MGDKVATIQSLEELACSPAKTELKNFNKNAKIPYGVTIEHMCAAMNDFIEFLCVVNGNLHQNKMQRIETMLMPANFSSLVGEFMSSNLPKHSKGIVKNRYHNGHPDLIPAGKFPGDAVQYAHDGIEIKGSRYLKSWQGHNPEDIWLMVFIFDGNRLVDEAKGLGPRPFRFQRVLGAELKKSDWLFAGRSETSRRTITASVTDSGYRKMMANWIYNNPGMPSISASTADPSTQSLEL